MARYLCWAVGVVLLLPGIGRPQETKPLTRIALGSCADQNKPCPIWGRLAEQKPDLLVLLGDNIYADLEDGKLVPAKPDKIARCYRELAELPAFKALRERTPILATWDDHDYGSNDAGVEYEFKGESQKLFLDFLGVPADSPRRSRQGVYHAETFGPPGRRVQVILLDARYHRSKLAHAERPLPGTRIRPYLPNTDPGATFLGEEQWKWLEARLREPAELRLIGSGIQVIAEDHPFEKWMNIPAERERLYRLIRETGANGVVFLSGDRHHGELSMDPDAVGYPLYDLTSSGLNQASRQWRAPEPNRHRVASMAYGDNFGMVVIDWSKPDPTVSLQLRDDTGEVTVRQTVPLSVLRAKGPPVVLPAGTLSPEEARRRLGAEVTVQFRVQSGRAVGKRILLNSEKDFRNARNFTVVVSEPARTGLFSQATFETFQGKTIRARGKVTQYKEQIEIVVEDAKQLEIVAEK